MSAVVVAEDLSAAPQDELAARIDEAHAGVERSFKAGVEHALRAGTLLLEAKARVPHGKWGAWPRDNVRCSARTARARGINEPTAEAIAERIFSDDQAQNVLAARLFAQRSPMPGVGPDSTLSRRLAALTTAVGVAEGQDLPRLLR